MEISKSSMEVELPLCTGRIRMFFFFLFFFTFWRAIYTYLDGIDISLPKRPLRRWGGRNYLSLSLSLSLKVPNLLSKPPPSSLLHHKCRIAIGRNMGGGGLCWTKRHLTWSPRVAIYVSMCGLDTSELKLNALDLKNLSRMCRQSTMLTLLVGNGTRKFL